MVDRVVSLEPNPDFTGARGRGHSVKTPSWELRVSLVLVLVLVLVGPLGPEHGVVVSGRRCVAESYPPFPVVGSRMDFWLAGMFFNA